MNNLDLNTLMIFRQQLASTSQQLGGTDLEILYTMRVISKAYDELVTPSQTLNEG